MGNTVQKGTWGMDLGEKFDGRWSADGVSTNR